jgi:hypothetical protein
LGVIKTMTRTLIGLLLGLAISMQTQAEDRWAVATGSDNGRPLIYRYILAPPEGIKIGQYPNLLGISWKYDGSARSGMPDPATNQRMVLLEELLEKKLEGTRNAFLTVSVTGNGRKEWQWYSRDIQETMKLLNEALQGQDAFPIQISRQDDPKWSAYFGILNAAK